MAGDDAFVIFAVDTVGELGDLPPLEAWAREQAGQLVKDLAVAPAGAGGPALAGRWEGFPVRVAARAVDRIRLLVLRLDRAELVRRLAAEAGLPAGAGRTLAERFVAACAELEPTVAEFTCLPMTGDVGAFLTDLGEDLAAYDLRRIVRDRLGPVYLGPAVELDRYPTLDPLVDTEVVPESGALLGAERGPAGLWR